MIKQIPAVLRRLGGRGPEEHGVTAPRAVLVVDDETSVRAYVSRVLQSAGFEVVVAGSGSEALERFNDMKHCDLVLTDLMMPKMNGDELARRLRCEQPELKVLYMTGFSDRLFTDKGTLWDGEAFLDKPCSPKAVLESVSLLLTGRLNAVVPS
jgi:two-component system, cell cycle sensor histidine kinase and response regulator CckA